tara:strand:- start:1674 stop:1844 length:171 start_codon:yes stop_codon:yes gene_type:complete
MENPTVEQIVSTWTYQQQKGNQVMLNLVDGLIQQNKMLQEALAVKTAELEKTKSKK